VNILDLQQLSFERDHCFLFENLCATLHSGEILQVKGANGSGKTTLLRILASFIAVKNKSVLWNQQCIVKQRVCYQQALHYIGHQSGVKPHLTVKENLKLNTALQGGDDVSIATAIVKTGLQNQQDTRAQLLSAGQLRRLALARLILTSRPLWILDEPAAALDTAGQALLTQLMTDHIFQGGMAIVATHQNLFDFAKTLELGIAHA
jgi:heme exporter protein A